MLMKEIQAYLLCCNAHIILYIETDFIHCMLHDSLQQKLLQMFVECRIKLFVECM